MIKRKMDFHSFGQCCRQFFDIAQRKPDNMLKSFSELSKSENRIENSDPIGSFFIVFFAKQFVEIVCVLFRPHCISQLLFRILN